MNQQERLERLALTAARATSGCRTFEPEVCSACATRLNTARSAVNAAINYEREAIAVGHDKRCDWHLNRAQMLEAIPEARERDARALERSRDHYEQSRFHAESAQAIRNGEHAKEEA